jgi:hypothetical protein
MSSSTPTPTPPGSAASATTTLYSSNITLPPIALRHPPPPSLLPPPSSLENVVLPTTDRYPAPPVQAAQFPLVQPPEQREDGREFAGAKQKKEIKRRTKTGCLTCRTRRIKVGFAWVHNDCWPTAAQSIKIGIQNKATSNPSTETLDLFMLHRGRLLRHGNYLRTTLAVRLRYSLLPRIRAETMPSRTAFLA